MRLDNRARNSDGGGCEVNRTREKTRGDWDESEGSLPFTLSSLPNPFFPVASALLTERQEDATHMY